MNIKHAPTDLPFKRILHTWWPLAASWMLMGAELPALSGRAPGKSRNQSGGLWRDRISIGLDRRIADYHAAGGIYGTEQKL